MHVYISVVVRWEVDRQISEGLPASDSSQPAEALTIERACPKQGIEGTSGIASKMVHPQMKDLLWNTV